MRMTLYPAIAAVILATSAHAAPSTGPTHGAVTVEGVRLHYVVQGEGDPVVLVAGWPESWRTWKRITPQLLAAHRRVYLLDPRGFGDSARPEHGYSPSVFARDLHGFIAALDLASNGHGVDVVGHDIGTWIAYFHAATYPQDVRRLVLTEATLPGVTPPPADIPSDMANTKTWQFSFNRLDTLPETLVQGHERAFITWLFEAKSMRPWTIDPATLDEYVADFERPGAARAGFAYYRETFSAAGLAEARAVATHRLAMPVLAIGGEGGVGDALLRTLQPRADNVSGQVLAGCGHFLPDECPAEFGAAITAFWSRTP
jgi:pimeloyl-ACP methyl ester carboxylesterase